MLNQDVLLIDDNAHQPGSRNGGHGDVLGKDPTKFAVRRRHNVSAKASNNLHGVALGRDGATFQKLVHLVLKRPLSRRNLICPIDV